MPENRHARFLLLLLYITLALLGAWIALRFLVPWLLPFLIALALSALLEGAVAFCMDRLRLKRWVAAALCTLLLAAGLLALLFFAVWRLGYEASLLIQGLPALLDGLPSLVGRLESWTYRMVMAAPVSLQAWLQSALDGLIAQGSTLPLQLYDWLLDAVSAAASALPDAVLFLFTTGLATYFSTAHRPALLSFLRRQVPRPWRSRVHTAAGRLRTALGGWLRAQGTLMLITFAELTAGFFLLQVDLALLLAALVSLVDALPVFGTGTVLLPWAAVTLLGGDWHLALGLLILYAAVSAVRSLLEPKLVGDRVGLPPLAALMAMYVGFRAFGVAGMVLAPLAALLLKELHDCGFLRLWRD